MADNCRMCVRILLLVSLAGLSDGLYSKWLHNTDLNNPYNWDVGRLPCGNDRMIIPDDGPVVFMQMNTTIQELVLPRNGKLVFGSYATLAFTNEPDHSATCLDSGADVLFNASHPGDWLDPLNWCPADTETGPCKSTPLLHTEMVPCVTDDVLFPRGSSYYVDLGTNLNLQVNTMKVSGKAYSTSSFRDFLATDNGRSIFPVPSSGRQSTVTINRHRCTDQTGCACGNDQGLILEAVCRVQTSRCPRPQCKSTMKPVGHCCDICGGMLNVTYGAGFNLNNMKSSLQNTFMGGKRIANNVVYIVSKRSDGIIQIVLTDDDGVKSSDMAMKINMAIQDDINNGGFKYAVTKVKMQTSMGGSSGTGPNTSAHTGSSGSSSSSGTTAGITIGVIIAVIIAGCVGYFVYRHKTRPESDLGFKGFKGFDVFNKFNVSQKRKPQVSVPPSIGFGWGSQDSGVSSVTGGSRSQGFDNPIYGSTPLENMKSSDLEMTPSDYRGMSDTQPIEDRGFDNPLYDTAHQVSLFDDPTVVEKPELDTVMTIGGPGQKSTDA